MSNKQLNSVEQDSTENNSSLNQPSSRRGFFKKAAIGSALITTVTSRPVWAGTCTLSGNLSNNTSNQDHGHTCPIKGFSHGRLKNTNKDTFAASGKNYSDNLAELFSSVGITPPVEFDETVDNSGNITKPAARIGDAFDMKHYSISPAFTNDNLGGVNTGTYQQLTTAIINYLIWNNIMDLCVSDVNSDICQAVKPGSASDIESEFYFPLTINEIQNYTGNWDDYWKIN